MMYERQLEMTASFYGSQKSIMETTLLRYC